MFKFKGKEWQEGSFAAELSMFLQHPANDDRLVPWDIEATFNPVGYDPLKHNYTSVEYLTLDAHGYLPPASDWRDLEGKLFEPRENIWIGPEVRVHSYGPGKAHWKGPDTLACQVRFRRREGWRFEVEVSAWFTREASMMWQIRQMCRQLVTADGEEEEEELPEEWTNSRDLYWVGEVHFTGVSCLVPINAPQPIELTKRLAGKCLNLSEFREVRLNADTTKPVTPESGLYCDGRLVIAVTPHF